jgi:tetratricopeptide (TPR) repeat protein
MAHVASQDRKAQRRPRLSLPRRRWAGLLAAAIVVPAAGWLLADWWYGIPEGAQATYVGRRTCIECHREQWQKFEHSHHDLAMDRATPATVLGDFSGATLTHHGVTSRMYQRDGRFFIETEGPDGKMGEFEIKYVFGVEPLQQYMVEFDRPPDMPENEIARLQVLRVSWDTRKKQWFHLDPPDVKEKLDPSDDLHWTGIAQRWNSMCADCHSTNLQRNFDETTRTYHTTFSEIDVSCEACHGPGSLHVQLARQISPFWDRRRGYGLVRLKGQPSFAELQTCAPCHSRRSTIHGGFNATCNFHDYFAAELLGEGTYHADGQILDEVYEYGSFVQSKMYHKGVRCTDCHDPHSTRLKHSGNEVCTSCHAHPRAKYDAITHHNHMFNTEAARCVTCHMPEWTYMDVDPRRDHSFRAPRPDLSAELGTPNACTGCHISGSKLPPEQKPKSLIPGRPAEYADWLREARQGNVTIQRELAMIDRWAARRIREWFPLSERRPHFGTALHAARRQAPDAQQQLIALLEDLTQPDIARATAAAELGPYVHSAMTVEDPTIAALLGALRDRDPQVRAAAVGSLQDAADDVLTHALWQKPAPRGRQVVPVGMAALLQDPVRLVRNRAAWLFSGRSQELLRRQEPAWLKEAVDELLAGALVDNDRAGGRLLRGTVLENLGRTSEAQAEYELAAELEPLNVAPKTSLARLVGQLVARHEQQMQQAAVAGNRAAAEDYARQAAELASQFEQLKADEWSLLERDARLVPDNAALQLQLGLARHHQGWKRESVHALETAWRMSPRTPMLGYYLAVLYREEGRLEEARALARRLVELRPGHPQYEQLRRELEEDKPP